MLDATYWWEEAEKLERRAKSSERKEERKELLELADVCKEVAADIEQRCAGG